MSSAPESEAASPSNASHVDEAHTEATMNEEEEDDGGMEDLFGDEEQEQEQEEVQEEEEEVQEEDEDLPSNPRTTARRQLDDEDLDSGDDLERTDRAPEDGDLAEEYETREKTSIDLELVRRPIPEPSDGEMYILKIPGFMEIEPLEWQHDRFQPPTTDHHSRSEPSATFSAYNTAMSTLRWRRSPTDQSKLQSNARILRWSDGSLTLQLASEPTVQYEIDGNALAAPQRNPFKPTPTSVETGQKGGRQGDGTVAGEKYDASKDAFTYMLLPDENAQSLRAIHKLTVGLSVKQSDSSADDAIERLQAALASAANATKVNGTGNLDLKLIDEDPEERRRKAEEMMRQKAKADRKREAAVQREAERTNRALGRHGLSSGRYGGGLSAGMLEDEEGDGYDLGRSRAAPRKRRQRRGSEYSTDEDLGRNRFSTKQDEYDEEDDFVARSDEEEEVIDDDDEDEDDGIVDDFAQQKRSPKRDRAKETEEDEDAEGEADDEVQTSRTKRRRIIDEEDDDDDE